MNIRQKGNKNKRKNKNKKLEVKKTIMYRKVSDDKRKNTRSK